VTGASSGIGEAVSSHFRREGAQLLLTGRREQLDTAQPDDLYGLFSMKRGSGGMTRSRT
jgi:short-subunit dehydrogenase